MEFTITRKNHKKKQMKFYEHDELDVAYRFSKVIHKELGHLIKGLVLFGSTARGQNNNGDIDILMILDDCTVEWTSVLGETYKIIIEQKIAEVSKRIHVTTLRLTTFWEYIRLGDPMVINMLRDGVAIIDTGFFDPLQIMLKQGKIQPSVESVINYSVRAESTLFNARGHLLSATVDLYWSCVDMAHALLMYHHINPPGPADIADALREHVKIEKKHIETMRLLYKLYKGIHHRSIDHLSGNQFEHYYALVEQFIKAAQKIMN
ncbi:MAG: nucleotidyltransferase domain-containing protein [Candidatus Woesearchaeota archaeon]